MTKLLTQMVADSTNCRDQTFLIGLYFVGVWPNFHRSFGWQNANIYPLRWIHDNSRNSECTPLSKVVQQQLILPGKRWRGIDLQMKPSCWGILLDILNNWQKHYPKSFCASLSRRSQLMPHTANLWAGIFCAWISNCIHYKMWDEWLFHS